MEEKEKQEEKSQIKETMVALVEGFLKNIGLNIVDLVKTKANEINKNIQKRIFSTVFIYLGVIFIFVGLVKLIELYFGTPGVGYLICGIVILLMGLIAKIFSK